MDVTTHAIVRLCNYAINESDIYETIMSYQLRDTAELARCIRDLAEDIDDLTNCPIGEDERQMIADLGNTDPLHVSKTDIIFLLYIVGLCDTFARELEAGHCVVPVPMIYVDGVPRERLQAKHIIHDGIPIEPIKPYDYFYQYREILADFGLLASNVLDILR
jgi:hypothetical protein